MYSVDWKKKAQHESCELSFIWGKMRNIAWETAFQMVLRNCSKEVVGKVSAIYMMSVKGGMCSQAHILGDACC